MTTYLTIVLYSITKNLLNGWQEHSDSLLKLQGRVLLLLEFSDNI